MSTEVARSSTLTSLKDMVELAGKLFLAIIALVYVMGLIVVNIYLNNFGVFSPSLLRVNYITAGVWALSPIITVLLTVILIAGVVFQLSPSSQEFLSDVLKLESPEKDWGPRFSVIFLLLIFICSLVLFIIAAQSFGLRSTLFARNIWLTSILTAAVCLISIPGVILNTHIISRGVNLLFFVLIIGLLLYAHSYEFARTAYGEIPPSIGGGKPKEVQLVIDAEKEKRKTLESLGIIFQSAESNLTLNMSLLLVTEDEYVLLVKVRENHLGEEAKTVEKGLTLSRDQVQAILYEGARFSLGGGGGDSY